MLRVLILLVALSAAGVAAWLTVSTQSGEQIAASPQSAPQVMAEDVLVVSADLSQGQRLDETNVRWQSWPADGINPNFIMRSTRPEAVAELSGSVVRSRFVAGEPIRQEKLASPDSGFLSAVLPSGMRAVAIRISAENTAGGFILPDDRVDVIHTVTQPGDIEGVLKNESNAILTNVRVLAIDQRTEETGGEAVVVGKTATLELSPEQVETISRAQASGLLSLALRSVADSLEVPMAEHKEPEPISRTVRILRAGSIQLVETPDVVPPSVDLIAENALSMRPDAGTPTDDQDEQDGPRS